MLDETNDHPQGNSITYLSSHLKNCIPVWGVLQVGEKGVNNNQIVTKLYDKNLVPDAKSHKSGASLVTTTTTYNIMMVIMDMLML